MDDVHSLEFMPLIFVGNLVIGLNPNGLERHPRRRCQILILVKFIGNLFHQKGHVSNESYCNCIPHPVQLIHNKSGPPPCLPIFNAIPKLLIDWLIDWFTMLFFPSWRTNSFQTTMSHGFLDGMNKNLFRIIKKEKKYGANGQPCPTPLSILVFFYWATIKFGCCRCITRK